MTARLVLTTAALALVCVGTHAEDPPFMPRFVGHWWTVRDPDLVRLTNPNQQPLDFGIWQAADGTWQIWSSIRGTKEPSKTRLFHRWEGAQLTDSDWTPKGIALQADPALGETEGGLQAPYVVPHGGKYWMFYGDWVNISLATSVDGKAFTRYRNSEGKPQLNFLGPVDRNRDTRDPMVRRIGDQWYCYYTAHPNNKGCDYARTSADLIHWSAERVVAARGKSGDGPYSAECPFVVEPKPGHFYLFRTQRYGKEAQTTLYYSRDPLDFGIDNHAEHYVTTLPVAAPEVFQHEAQWYMAALLPSLKGIQITRMEWVPKSERPGKSVRPDIDRGLSTSTNVVRLRGNSLCDDGGPLLGLGASYFQALRDARYDRPRLNYNLALLASKGFNYIRVLSMVSWDGLEIAPVAFTNRFRREVPVWPDYWQLFRDLLDLAGQHGLRVQVTIFADAQYVMPERSVRLAHLDGILANIAGREDRVMLLEVANEAWQNGFPGAQGVQDLHAFTTYLAERTPVLVATTSNDDTSNLGITALYAGSAADLATVHFSRDTRTPEGGWLPVRDCYRAGQLSGVPPVMSNEPIGPGASVAAESDPIKLCSAAVFAYLANLPGYVFHSRTGIYGYEHCCPPSAARMLFEDTPGIKAFCHLRQLLPPDLASWTRNDGIESSAPFTVFCNGKPNQYWPDVRQPVDGCVRNIGSSKGGEFVCLPMGILDGGVTLEARRTAQFQVFDPLTGAVITNLTLEVGKRFTLPPSPRAYIIKGSTQ